MLNLQLVVFWKLKIVGVNGKGIYYGSCSWKKKDGKLRNGVLVATINSWDQHHIMTQTTKHENEDEAENDSSCERWKSCTHKRACSRYVAAGTLFLGDKDLPGTIKYSNHLIIYRSHFSNIKCNSDMMSYISYVI